MEPAGNIHGRWKQFSRRILPVPEPATSHRFQQPETKGTLQYPPGSSRTHHHIRPEMTVNNNVNHRKSSEPTVYPRHKNQLPEFRFPNFSLPHAYSNPSDFPKSYFKRRTFDGEISLPDFF